MWLQKSLLSRIEVVVLTALLVLLSLGRCSPINPSISKSTLRDTPNPIESSNDSSVSSSLVSTARLKLRVLEAFVSPKDVFKNIRPKAIVFSDDENSRQFSELMKTGMTDLTLDDSSALKLETTAAFIQLSDDASSSVVHSALNAELVIERDKTDSKHLILTLENRSVLENMTSLSLSSSGHPTVKEEAEIFRQN